MAVQFTTVSFEALVTFTKAIPVIDLETEEATLTTQDMRYVSVILDSKGQATEADVLFAVLSELSATERALLAKVSLCLMCCTESEAKTIAPWLWHKDSPLYDGKLWLRQADYATV